MLKFVGDISLTDGYFDVGFGVGSKIAKGFDPFGNLIRGNKDYWVGNFEGVASEHSDNTGDASKYFRICPDYLKNLRHFDAYGIANNHAMQHGSKAYERTFSYLESLGCVCFGSDVKKTQIIEHQGRKISLTGFSQRIDNFSKEPSYWYNPEYNDIKDEYLKIPSEAYKVAFVHWGDEFISYPSTHQKRFAHWLIDLGFDLIIGMHPHVLQGFEIYKGKYIFYSIGNFVFDMPWERTKYGAIISLDFDSKTIKPQYDYIKIDESFCPSIVKEEDVPYYCQFKYLNEKLLIEQNNEEYYNEVRKQYISYRKANHRDIVAKMIGHPSLFYGVMSGFVKRRLIKK